jgi:hypothetical protein
MNSAAPPIQATIAPIWRTSRMRSGASAAIGGTGLGLECSGYYDMPPVTHHTFFCRKHRIRE